MPCPSAEELTALYEGCLPKVRADQLREHLSQCSPCALEINRLADILDGLPKEKTAPPADLLPKALELPDAKPIGPTAVRLSGKPCRALGRPAKR